MTTATISTSPSKKIINISFGIILLLVATSMITITQKRYTTVDYGLNYKIHELLNIENAGHLQEISTRILGPYTSIKLKYFEHENKKVSVRAYQLFWFEPIITCISSNPEYICQ